jgi:hypothetical protein
MPVLNCPLCGAKVTVEHVATNTRQFCKKCHTPFHLNKDWEGVIGEPPDAVAELEELKQKIRQKVKRFPVGRVVAVAAAVVVAWVVLSTFFGPTERLDRVAERAAQAIADNDPAYLESIAAPDTAEDVARWFDAVHPKLVQERQRWSSLDEAVDVHVTKEDKAQHTGVVGISIHPAPGPTRIMALSSPDVTVAPTVPFDVETSWTLDRWGRWKLDGRATYAKARPGGPVLSERK